MRKIQFSPPLLTLLPGLTLLPVLFIFLKGIHNGGLSIFSSFIEASFHPALDAIVLGSSWRGLRVTIATALVSWSISTFIGLILGIFSSSIFWKTFNAPSWAASITRRILAIPRSIHEILWGLLLLQGFGLSPWVAVVAIVIPYSSLVARVLSNQLDALDHRALIAINQIGAKPFPGLITALGPPIIPIIASYSGYRLECALRSATLLGIFGLGGIGTDLQLTFQSLEFNEMWTGLWMLGLVMFSLELVLSWCRKNLYRITKKYQFSFILIPLTLTFTTFCFFWLKESEIGAITNFEWHNLSLPTLVEIESAFKELPLLTLIGSTLILTFLSAGIAIGIPPLGLMLFPSRLEVNIQSIIWGILRLIPPPLSSLLLLLFSNPSFVVAAIALGLHNIGIMGRLLKEGIDNQTDRKWHAMKATGAGPSASWLYGYMSSQSPSYLAYASYRTDVLLRETAVVGLIGGTGLGWQLIESLSSFNWAEVTVLIILYSSITLVGESISDYLSQFWMSYTTKKSTASHSFF